MDGSMADGWVGGLVLVLVLQHGQARAPQGRRHAGGPHVAAAGVLRRVLVLRVLLRGAGGLLPHQLHLLLRATRTSHSLPLPCLSLHDRARPNGTLPPPLLQGLLLLPLGATLTGYVIDHQHHCPWLLLAPAWDRSQLGIDILAVRRRTRSHRPEAPQPGTGSRSLTMELLHAGGSVCLPACLQVLWCVSLLACVIKQLVNVAQLLSAACTLADGDAAKRKD